MPASHSSQTILIIGGTGAQGLPSVRALLSAHANESKSTWRVRALTRDPTHRRAKELESLGVELVQGSFMDFDAVAKALEGVYGAFVNTDGFTVGEAAETFAGIKIYELAKTAGVRHFVWSNLDYASKVGNFDPQYRVGHYDAKGRVASFIMAQPNEVENPNGMMWTIFTNGPYMDMLAGGLFSPIKRSDGTMVFASPIGDGHVPMIALEDLGFFVRYIFDNPKTTAGQDLQVASDIVSWPQLVETFTKVTGIPAEYQRLSLSEYFDLFQNTDQPAGTEDTSANGMTWKKNFTGFWSMWRDDIIKRDIPALKAIHPGLKSLEQWMRETGYNGERASLLKNIEDQKLAVSGAVFRAL